MQYLIQYRRGAGSDWMTLEPGVHGAMYKKTKVQEAIEHMEANEHILGMVVQLPVKDEGAEQFNIVRVAADNPHPHVFKTKQ
jgi:5,10-methylene-tetrahydrofolate dehydrogenase/methenyl tetrahydrofolate cyclohydrolase